MGSLVSFFSSISLFPGGGLRVAVAGSRSLVLPSSVVSAFFSALPSGSSISVGCAFGVDRSLLLGASSRGVRSFVFVAFSSRLYLASLPFCSLGSDPLPLPPARALGSRTSSCVSSADCLVVFVRRGGVLGRGTALAVRVASSRGLPIFYYYF